MLLVLLSWPIFFPFTTFYLINKNCLVHLTFFSPSLIYGKKLNFIWNCNAIWKMSFAAATASAPQSWLILCWPGQVLCLQIHLVSLCLSERGLVVLSTLAVVVKTFAFWSAASVCVLARRTTPSQLVASPTLFWSH